MRTYSTAWAKNENTGYVHIREAEPISSVSYPPCQNPKENKLLFYYCNKGKNKDKSEDMKEERVEAIMNFKKMGACAIAATLLIPASQQNLTAKPLLRNAAFQIFRILQRLWFSHVLPSAEIAADKMRRNSILNVYFYGWNRLAPIKRLQEGTLYNDLMFQMETAGSYTEKHRSTFLVLWLIGCTILAAHFIRNIHSTTSLLQTLHNIIQPLYFFIRQRRFFHKSWKSFNFSTISLIFHDAKVKKLRFFDFFVAFFSEIW